MPHPLDGCQAKCQRAYQHVQEFTLAVQAFFDHAPYRVRGEVDEDTEELVLRVDADASFPAIPLEISLIAGEVVHQLRSALDHLVWQLIVAHRHQPPTGTKSGFPIFLLEGGYKSPRAQAMIEGVSPEAAACIQGAQPYHLGVRANESTLWVLHELSNADKHRLIPVVTTRGHTAEGWITRDGTTYAPFLRDESWGARLKHDAEITRVPLRDNPYVKVYVPTVVDVAFQEVGGLKDARATPLLNELVTNVWEVLMGFRGAFARSH